MNFYDIKREFDDLCRTGSIDGMSPLRDRWLNQAWKKLSESFVIPSLVKNTTISSVADQATYLFPYDYGGTEINLMYSRRRLDPVLDETLSLKYEYRSGSMGVVRFYDWSGVIGSDLLVVRNCTLTNGSDTVLTDSTDTILDVGYWVRFDPYEDADNADADADGMVDPGEYGYQIKAGDQVSGISFKLTTPYRGPSGDKFVVRVRPAEQQQFRVYGIPTANEDDAFSLRYASRPKRLYNDSDVPEWPDAGVSISYMALSIALEWYHNMDLAKTFWGRAMQNAQKLERRRNRSQALVSDLTIGSVVGRRTGIMGVYTGHTRSRGIGRYR